MPMSISGRGWNYDPKGIVRIGYRYQPLSGGFNFGLTFTPLVSVNDFPPSVNFLQRLYIQPWGGISLGWGF
jgi:hypothetical protein